MADHSEMKLGKLAAKKDPRRLRLGNYLSKDLDPPPPSCDNTNGRTSWGMMVNDRLGCCTIAGVGHAETTLVGYTPSDAVILAYYQQWDGYNPADPSTDQGGYETNVLDQWRKNTFNGHPLLAYADPTPGNLQHIKQSIFLFGGVYIGVSLPISAQTQDVWDTVDGPDGAAGSWGGHCVWCPAYDETSIICVTWGELKKMTYSFWAKYCDEAHTLLVPEWPNWGQKGVDIATLQSDLAAITG